MESIKSLKNKLISNDIESLKQCNSFLNQIIEREKQRGHAAETRSSILLTIAAAGSAFITFFFDKLPDTSDPRNILVTTIYALSALWLSRAIIYSIKSTCVQSRMQVSYNSIFDMQQLSEIDTLKTIIACKIWELDHSISPNTNRLFYIQRAQRSLLYFIFIIFFECIALSINDLITFKIKQIAFLFIIIFALSFLFLGDRFIEKRGIWTFK